MSLSNMDLRRAIVAALDETLDAQTRAYEIPQDQVHQRFVMVGALEWERSTFDGDRVARADLLIGVSRANSNNLVDLEALCDISGPVVTAFDGDPVNEHIESWLVTQVGQQGISEIGGTVYYTAEAALEVYC